MLWTGRPIFEIGRLEIFYVQVGRPILKSVGNFENLLFLPLFLNIFSLSRSTLCLTE